MKRDLNQKMALVTGGAQGIGPGIAFELARAGATVVIADLDRQKGQAAVDEIQAMGREAIALQLDVMDSESVKRCVEEAIKGFSRVDILVNNAGAFQTRLGLELGEDDFNRCLDTNVTGMWRMVRAMVPHFRAQGAGKIVNIASVGGRRGVDFAPAYCASKAAVINLTQSLAAALGADNINVNTVCPGSISTAMQDEIKPLRARLGTEGNRELPALPLAGPLTVEDIGHAVVFFASDYAKNITGQALNVDCGYLMN